MGIPHKTCNLSFYTSFRGRNQNEYTRNRENEYDRSSSGYGGSLGFVYGRKLIPRNGIGTSLKREKERSKTVKQNLFLLKS
jgi:hypothetical protein